MPTYTNISGRLMPYIDDNGNYQHAASNAVITSYQRLDQLNPGCWSLDSESPVCDRVMRAETISLSGTNVETVELTADEVKYASRIIVMTKGANHTLAIHFDDPDCKPASLVRTLDVNGGFTYVKIYPAQTVSKIYLKPNQSQTAYVYIDRDYPNY